MIDFPIRVPPTPRACTKGPSPLIDLAKMQDNLAPCLLRSLWVEEEASRSYFYFLPDIDGKGAQHVLKGWWRVLAQCLTPFSSMCLILRRLRWLATVRMLSGGWAREREIASVHLVYVLFTGTRLRGSGYQAACM